MASFPAFSPPNTYPRPDLENINLDDPFPTNSWNQEHVVNNIADTDRVANGTPWYLKSNYSNVTVGLSYGNVNDIITSLNFGNKILQESPTNRIDINIIDSDKLKTVNLTDLSTELVYSENGKDVGACKFVRGSPTIVFNAFSSSVLFTFKSGIIKFTSIDSQTYALDTVIPISSTVSQNMTKMTDMDLFKSDNLTFFKGVNPIPNSPIEASYGIIDGSNIVRAVYQKDGNDFDLKMSIDNTNVAKSLSTYPEDLYDLTLQGANGEDVLGFVLTNIENGEVDKIIFNTNSLANVVTVSRIPQEIHRWIIYTDASIITSDQATRTVRTNRFTGFFNVAYNGRIEGDQINYFGQIFPLDSLVLVDAFRLGTITSGIVEQFTENTDGSLTSWSYNMTYNSTGVLFIPSHLTSTAFAIQGAEQYRPKITWPSLSYGDMKLYRVIDGNIIIHTAKIKIENFQSVEGLLFGDKSKRLMRQLIILDADQSIQQLVTIENENIITREDLNPYTFGLIVAKAARVLLLAVKLQEELSIDQIIIDILQLVIRSNLLTWLNGTNNPNGLITYQLQRDPVWSGIIVPADAINASDNDTPTSYGNSFYSDHHFQYGYIIYALAALEEIDFGLIPEFRANISSLVNDYCNPDFNTFTRVRHKDFFMGHSWATGVPGIPTRLPGVIGAGPVNRQEESSGEAINSYYSAYLIANHLNDNKLRTAAGLSLFLEIFSARNYFLYDGANTDIGVLEDTGCIGIMQTLGKSYTLNWEMQPPTFPGRTFGIHGIQSLPFTEITGNYLINNPIIPFNEASSRYAERMSQFGMSSEIVMSVLDGSYMPNPAQQGSNNLVPYIEGFKWGNVATQILSFSSEAASNEQIRELFTLIINKGFEDEEKPILGEFDSFSNTYYILLRLRGINITPLNTCMYKIKNKIKNRNMYKNRNMNMYKNMYGSMNGQRHEKRHEKRHENRHEKIHEINGKIHGVKRTFPVQIKFKKKNSELYNKESDLSSSNIDSSSSSTKSSKSKMKREKNKYIYEYKNFRGELYVIKLKCAMLKIYYDKKEIIVQKDKLPYILKYEDKSININQIAKFIIIYESDKVLNIFTKRVKHYMNNYKYKKYIDKYNK